MPEHTWVKDTEGFSPSILRLQETLREQKIDLNLTSSSRLEVLHNRLRKAMDTKDQLLSEVLLKSDAGAVAKVLDIVWDAARDPDLSIGRRLCQVYTQDAPSIKIPKAAKAVHNWIGSTGRARASEETTSFVTVTAKTSGGLASISKEMIEDAAWDVVERQLAEQGAAYSEFQSNVILSQLVTDAGTSAAAATAGTLKFKDVADMMASMWSGKKRRPATLVLNPTEFADLLNDSAIQNWITYRNDEFVPGGQVPYLPGLRVEVNALQASGTALLIDTKHAGALFLRRDLTIEEVDDPVHDLVDAPARARWNYGTVDANAIGKITSA